MTAMIPATPAKLRSGDWGARAPEHVADGDILTIRTKSGKQWEARVTKVVWRGDGVALCATESLDHPRSNGGRSRRRGEWCECGSSDDLGSFGYRHGSIIRCPECGRKAEVV